MLNFLRAFFYPSPAPADTLEILSSKPASEIKIPDAGAFPIAAHIVWEGGLPYLDWAAVTRWLDTLESPEIQAEAWAECEVAWLLNLKDTLGDDFYLARQGPALLLSSLEPALARATLEYMSKTLRRIERILAGIASVPEWGKEILVVFDSDERYYQYVAHYYPEGEFAASGGMYLSAGCGHFVTMKADLHVIEPVIAHEMTHGCLSHLKIPDWLNEGLAVNTERRISRTQGSLYPPKEMQDKHHRFWDESRIQEFWSGDSFRRTDDGNLLSYDLAQKMVEQFAANWTAFQAFVLSAEATDGGAAAAIEHFGLDLGEVAAAVIGCDANGAWTPKPGSWPTAQVTSAG